MSELSVRPATFEDARLLWMWRNDETTRQSAFQTAPIPWETHAEWLRGRLADAHCTLLIITRQETPVGHVRFEISRQGEAEVHVTIAPGLRGQGLGTQALRLASAEFVQRSGVRRVIAHVKPDNEASLRAFEKAGYRRAELVEIRGHEALRFVREART